MLDKHTDKSMTWKVLVSTVTSYIIKDQREFDRDAEVSNTNTVDKKKARIVTPESINMLAQYTAFQAFQKTHGEKKERGLLDFYHL